MNNFILRMVINGFGLYAAVALVPGITPQNPDPTSYVWLAVIFGLLNALVKPILKFLTCSIIFLTLGLFTLVINTGLFYLTGYIGSQFNVGFTIESFWSALVGAAIVSIISIIFNTIIIDDKKQRRKKRQQHR
ncbi:MAG: phage holin family protein [Chloroflexota bacterium]